MDTSDVVALIRQRAGANGIDPAMLLRIAQVESGLNPGAAAQTSSAKGLFQFTGPTWKQYGQGRDVLDPTANADAGARFTSSNIKTLGDAGLQPTAANVYLAHFLGPAGATKLLNADPSAPAASVVGDAAVRANPFLGRMSVADLRGWASRKMGEGEPPRPPMPIPNVPAMPEGAMAQATAQGPGMQGLGMQGPGAQGEPQPAAGLPSGALGMLSAMGAGAGSPGMPFRPQRPQMAPQGAPDQPQPGAPPSLDPQQANGGMLSQLIAKILQSHAGLGGQLDEARQQPLG